MKLRKTEFEVMSRLAWNEKCGPVISKRFVDITKRVETYKILKTLRFMGLITSTPSVNGMILGITGDGHKAMELYLLSFYKKPESKSSPLAGRAYVCPNGDISDEARRALYRGARYENYKGREIIDRTPIPASRALEGYRSSEVV